jgi:hypothetical protein
MTISFIPALTAYEVRSNKEIAEIFMEEVIKRTAEAEVLFCEYFIDKHL